MRASGGEGGRGGRTAACGANPAMLRVNYKSLDFKSILVSIPFLAVVAMLLRRSRRREVGGIHLARNGGRDSSIPLATAPVARSAYRSRAAYASINA